MKFRVALVRNRAGMAVGATLEWNRLAASFLVWLLWWTLLLTVWWRDPEGMIVPEADDLEAFEATTPGDSPGGTDS